MGRPIKDYPDYEVFENGSVFSKKSNRFLKSTKMSNGYLKVELSNTKGAKTILVHRLVAETFLENPKHFPIINHKDENKSNNDVSNLEWCSYKYNSNYGTAISRRIQNTDYSKENRKENARKNGAVTSKKVAQLGMDLQIIHVFKSIEEACKNTGISHSHIADVANGRRKSAGGYFWRFVGGDVLSGAQS